MPSLQMQQQPVDMAMTDALRKHLTRHVFSPGPVSQRRLNWESARPEWLREMFAEATGVFFYGRFNRWQKSPTIPFLFKYVVNLLTDT